MTPVRNTYTPVVKPVLFRMDRLVNYYDDKGRLLWGAVAWRRKSSVHPWERSFQEDVYGKPSPRTAHEECSLKCTMNGSSYLGPVISNKTPKEFYHNELFEKRYKSASI